MFYAYKIEFKQCCIRKKIMQRGLTTFARLSIVQNMLNSSYFINNLLKTICTVINMLEWCVFQRYLGIYILSINIKQLFGPNPCPNPAGVSYPPTPYIPWPLPFKTLDPSQGSRVLKGKGKGQPELTPGLPLPITKENTWRLNRWCLSARIRASVLTAVFRRVGTHTSFWKCEKLIKFGPWGKFGLNLVACSASTVYRHLCLWQSCPGSSSLSCTFL